jgi:excisionase family DNA binding protein
MPATPELGERKIHEFVATFLTFWAAEESTGTPVRYHLSAGGWIDLIVVEKSERCEEVQVARRSRKGAGLQEVFSDMMARLRPNLSLQESTNGSPSSLQDIIVRLERLEERMLGTEKGRHIESPYLNAEEAAAYLRITMSSLYGLVERRKIRPLPGYRKYRFTKEILDAYLQGSCKV